jgi:hypothetical protein
MQVELTFGNPTSPSCNGQIVPSHGYIAHPYWPEMFRVIEILKQSGVNRARTEANRRRALEEFLKANQMTLADFEALEKLSQRPFHTNAEGRIVIPADRIASCLVNAVDMAPARIRIPNLRVALEISVFSTEKTEPDGVWERFAVVEGGQGKLSNQRGLRRNAYIRDFVAVGEINFDPALVKPKVVSELLDYAGREVGIGASRKMGWGRFKARTTE